MNHFLTRKQWEEICEAAIDRMVQEYALKAQMEAESRERCARFTAQIKAMR